MEQSDIVERLNEGAAHCGMCGAQAVEKNSRDQYICTACLHELRPDYAHVLRKEASAEITRLRAALADAQAVGFAAGVEAAAKAGSDAAIQVALRQNPELSPLRQQLIKQAIANPIRALTPPDATAAAARVLLEDDAAMNTLSDYEHRQWAGWFRHQLEQSTPENIERWKRQADMPFALLSAEEKAVDRRFADAALRAIAGDTP